MDSFSPGIYAIHKPKGVTSHDIIYQLRKLTGIKRIGHAGTLDPLASGVLVVAIDREYTKQLDKLMQTEKEYLAEITLGQTSTTDDEEGEKREYMVDHHPTEEEVRTVISHWIGEVDQVPPVYSAIKIKGTPAHRRIRRGQEVVLSSRKVQIYEIELRSYEWPVLQIKVRCDKGVYIRSLARDIGQDLKVGGYLSSLIRTRVGQFDLESAITM